MSLWRDRWFLPVGALGCIALALWTTDPAVATLLGGVAMLLAGAFVLDGLAPLLVPVGPEPPVVEADPLALLSRSFQGGRYGREAVLQRLDGLDLAAGRSTLRAPAEDEALLSAPDPAFLDYVERRIRLLEELT